MRNVHCYWIRLMSNVVWALRNGKKVMKTVERDASKRYFQGFGVVRPVIDTFWTEAETLQKQAFSS
jgi:hypothetical protein